MAEETNISRCYLNRNFPKLASVASSYHFAEEIDPINSISNINSSNVRLNSLLISAFLLTPVLVSAASQTTLPAPESLLSEYNQITNGRAFILRNWQLPESGGRFYAGKVADTCAGVVNFTDLLEQMQPNRVGLDDYLRASIAHQRLSQRCSQITPDELQAYSRARAATDSPPDKFAQLVKNQVDAQRSGSIEQQKTALSQVLEAGDPLVIDEIGAFMAFRNSSTGRFYSLNGVRYSWAERDIVLASFYLAPCKLGLACDSDPLIDMQCLSGAGCFANRQERADKEMLEFDHKKILAVELLSNEIAQAVRDKNVGFFFP